MIHPDTCLRWISPEIGQGIFATKSIPAGTITYIQDELDIVLPPDSALIHDDAYRDIVERYSFLDARGNRILSWDHAKFMNHCCFPNTLTTGYGFEIAIRPIESGEEVTDDYGVFTTSHEMNINCENQDCRRRISFQDFDRMAPIWDQWIQDALVSFEKVDQPLKRWIDPILHRELNRFLGTGVGYRSVTTQKPRSVERAPDVSTPTQSATTNGRASARGDGNRDRKSRFRA